jgi:hypothetical protein
MPSRPNPIIPIGGRDVMAVSRLGAIADIAHRFIDAGM